MEACASSHHWGRAISDLGHEVRLIPPAYVKPFVKRQKNDMADAEAIAEAVSRPTMRFVAVKSEAQQAAAMAYRRDRKGRRSRDRVGCPVRSCRVKIFAERPGDGIAQRYGRRTTQLQGLVRCLGLALGGRPAQALASRLLLPVSKDTLLRSIRSGIPTQASAPPPRIIGIDDWAWTKGPVR